MLVLTRKPGESIVVGDNVVVTVLEVRGNQIRLGVDAHHSIPVHRAEVYQQVVAENQAAVASIDLRSEALNVSIGGLRLTNPDPV